jgi:hypothetical protein
VTPRRTPFTDEELRAISPHLLYEIEMYGRAIPMLVAISDLEASTGRTTLRNALQESWALHMRNLLSFLYDKDGGKQGVVAADYVGASWPKERGAKPPILRQAHGMASKQIAHLGSHRAEIGEAERTWHHEPIIVELGKVLRAFLDALPEQRAVEGFHQRARGVLPSRSAPLTLHGLEVISGATQAF